ncbi:MAG TPA: keto:oxoacid ferredoxin oxidoreductase [Clostridiales bacterium]|nr:keto:oxoacid ferredoxin oxidoreductase [Clostridiales bacterium]
MREIVFAGFGGQGVLTAGLIVSQIALYKGVNATWMPAYGAAQRGGTANCTVKYGAEKIYNVGQQKPDLVLAMNTPSFKKFVTMVKPGGTILVNADMMTADTNVRDDIRVVSIHCNELAEQVKNPKGANIVMIGVITKLLGDFSHDEGRDGMNDMFRKKGKSKFEEKNVAAFEAGYNAI